MEKESRIIKKAIPCLVCDGTKIDPDTNLPCNECNEKGEMTITIEKRPKTRIIS